MDMTRTPLPGLVIAAPRSGAGKTTVSLGLMRALAKGQSTVQPFKCGPDYIDGAFHEVATGRKCFNLDTWSMSRERIFSLVSTAGQGADIGVAEGVMGLFDGAACRGRQRRSPWGVRVSATTSRSPASFSIAWRARGIARWSSRRLPESASAYSAHCRARNG
jgi:cobyrinic acid a,c-diamide synthase